MGGSESKPVPPSPGRPGRSQPQQGQPQPQPQPPPQHKVLNRSFTSAFRDKYKVIPDNFTSVAQVQEKLRDVGLESSNLIVGVDFTKSNEWTGKRTFQGRSLHHLSLQPNPYETAISIIGETLSAFDEDGLIPCYGFGDVTTHDRAVFSFYPDDQPCQGFPDALQRYRQIVPHVRLAGPTSFAPIIEQALRLVEESGGQYHVLLIIADGQVTRSMDLAPHEHSEQERKTIDAIVAASNYPLSIVMVGVGDGPWETMEEFDDALPQRNFDNFQFVNLSQLLATQRGTPEQRAARFALMALMEVPMQYRACAEMDIVGKHVGRMPPLPPLPPPPTVLAADARGAAAPAAAAPAAAPRPTAPAVPSDLGSVPSQGTCNGHPRWPPAQQQPQEQPAGFDANECAVCWAAPKGMAFQCGHQTCVDCGNTLQVCPICREPIALRIKLFA